YEYNDRGQLLKVTNANQHVTELAYSEFGDSTGYLESVRVDTGASGADLTTHFETDRRGNVTRVYDPRGTTHETDFNELDWMVESRRALTPANAGGAAVHLVTVRAYDENGNVTFESAGGSVTERDYGDLDEVLSETRPVSGGGLTVFSYGYDESFNVQTVTRPGGDVTRLDYDARNALTQVRRGFGTAEETPTTFVNDLEGRPTHEIDALTHARETVYDGYGRVARRVDANGNARAVEYDDRSRPALLRAYGAGDVLLAETRRSFDARDRPTKEIRTLWSEGVSGEEIETGAEYDALGNVTATIDEREKRTTFDYDGVERLYRRTDAAGNVALWTLDAGGNATFAESFERRPDGGEVLTTQSWAYDAL
ncbi:MAG: hypothetical protein K8H90_06050, partial [Thermoanaerobaculia bacterium]|nr:hypothetical protein [Thermoanaerobaculia bacterium]